MNENLILEKLISHRGKRNAECLGVKEEPYWTIMKLNKYRCPILDNQINLGDTVFHNLLEYSNEYIESC